MEHFSNAVAWNASTFQAATILGPAVGGVLYALPRGPASVYAASAVTSAIALVATLRIRSQSQERPREEMSLRPVMAGFRYVWREKVVLGSISLDMFAVLLGGAVALLPVYASEILKTGPWGLGLLRSAPGVGAAADGDRPGAPSDAQRARVIMLWCVAGFGVFTILFGVSRSLMLSLVALLLVGATRHGQRDHSRHAGADRHAGRDARARECGRHAVYRRVERVGPVRVGTDGALVRDRAGGGVGWSGNAGGDRALGVAVSGVAESGPSASASRISAPGGVEGPEGFIAGTRDAVRRES